MKVFEMISQFSAGVEKAKDTAVSFGRIKNFILEYNSTVDQEIQKANPLPAPTEADWLQIKAYFIRGFALAIELIQAVGVFCKQELKK